jgi:hypothetical protein
MPLKRISDLPAGTYDNASLLEVSVPTGSSPPYASRKVTASDFVAPSFNNAGRNLIHNSLLAVAQRTAGPFSVAGYTLDRWFLSRVADTASIQQTSHTDTTRGQIGDEAAVYAVQNAFTGNAAAGSFHYLWQPIESVRRLGGKTVTVSFWAASGSGTPKLGVSIDQIFGTGGSPSATVTGTGQAVMLSTTWARYTATFTIASTAGKTLGTGSNDYTALIFWYSAEASFNARSGSIGVQSGLIAIWGMQLEIGSAATPLEKPDPGYDSANCQRFYQTGYAYIAGYNLGGTSLGVFVPFNVTMRASPTITLSGQAYINASAASVTTPLQSGFVFGVTVTGTSAALGSASFQASADL